MMHRTELLPVLAKADGADERGDVLSFREELRPGPSEWRPYLTDSAKARARSGVELVACHAWEVAQTPQEKGYKIRETNCTPGDLRISESRTTESAQNTAMNLADGCHLRRRLGRKVGTSQVDLFPVV
jgi:hypothetical protein